jgi:hypothetical protein
MQADCRATGGLLTAPSPQPDESTHSKQLHFIYIVWVSFQAVLAQFRVLTLASASVARSEPDTSPIRNKSATRSQGSIQQWNSNSYHSDAEVGREIREALLRGGLVVHVACTWETTNAWTRHDITNVVL